MLLIISIQFTVHFWVNLWAWNSSVFRVVTWSLSSQSLRKRLSWMTFKCQPTIFFYLAQVLLLCFCNTNHISHSSQNRTSFFCSVLFWEGWQYYIPTWKMWRNTACFCVNTLFWGGTCIKLQLQTPPFPTLIFLGGWLRPFFGGPSAKPKAEEQLTHRKSGRKQKTWNWRHLLVCKKTASRSSSKRPKGSTLW